MTIIDTILWILFIIIATFLYAAFQKYIRRNP